MLAVVVDLVDSADTGRSNTDNITNKDPFVEGDLVFYFPLTAGTGRVFMAPALQFVNGAGSDAFAASPRILDIERSDTE